MKKTACFILLCSIPLLACPTVNRPQKKLDEPRRRSIKLPEGFKIAVYAKVDNARSLALGTKGTVFIGNRSGNKVYAVVDENKDGVADKQFVIASGLSSPNGVAFYEGDLYVAEISKIWRYRDIENKLDNPPKAELVSDSFPGDKHHGWKYIAFGPDKKLYVPVGAPCNICDKSQSNPLYSSITRMNPDGSGFEIFAHGIRNTVGFDWHPQSKELWFTENGRDMMGNDIPPDELNRAPKKGMHFGYPYCHGDGIKDPEFGKDNCSAYEKPAQNLAPHTAALGMKFYTGSMFPKEYRERIFIAEHGSWNREEPIGYRLMQVTLNGNIPVSYKVFAEGWLENGEAWGRPVDVLELPDGSLLLSDDLMGMVYRITYQN